MVWVRESGLVSGLLGAAKQVGWRDRPGRAGTVTWANGGFGHGEPAWRYDASPGRRWPSGVSHGIAAAPADSAFVVIAVATMRRGER